MTGSCRGKSQAVRARSGRNAARTVNRLETVSYGGDGGIVMVNSASDITTAGTKAYGIRARSVGGGGGDGSEPPPATVTVATPERVSFGTNRS